MPHTDILNPTTDWSADIQDSMTPDYGFENKRTRTIAEQKAVGGPPYGRETQATGHTFTLSWLDRSWACVRRLKRYYEQYEKGYFTIIDHDGGGRHYVGRFSSEVIPSEAGNDLWNVQNVQFDEIAGVPMVTYPHAWEEDGVWLYAIDDYGDPQLAISGTWAQTPRIFGVTPRTTFDNPGTLGDWCCQEYRGYGFQLQMLKGPEYGFVNVTLDDGDAVLVDLYAAQEMGPQIVLQQINVSLDIHRVRVTVASGSGGNSGSGSTAPCSYVALRVMR